MDTPNIQNTTTNQPRTPDQKIQQRTTPPKIIRRLRASRDYQPNNNNNTQGDINVQRRLFQYKDDINM